MIIYFYIPGDRWSTSPRDFLREPAEHCCKSSLSLSRSLSKHTTSIPLPHPKRIDDRPVPTFNLFPVNVAVVRQPEPSIPIASVAHRRPTRARTIETVVACTIKRRKQKKQRAQRQSTPCKSQSSKKNIPPSPSRPPAAPVIM